VDSYILGVGSRPVKLWRTQHTPPSGPLPSASDSRLWVTGMASIVIVPPLAANTSFADLPRLCRMVSEDGHMPHSFFAAGHERLVYSHCTYALVLLTALLLIMSKE